MYGGYVTSIPNGDAGTKATLAQMVQLVRAASLHPIVRRQAIAIVQDAAGLDDRLKARLIRDWVDSRVLFMPDPLGAELLHSPDAVVAHILTDGIANLDCDDVAMLAAALGRSVGLRSRFVAVGFSPNGPFRHVWSELGSPRSGFWLPVDPTRPMQGLAGLTIQRSYSVEV